MSDTPTEVSIEKAEKLMAQAANYLNEKHGSDFSSKNPHLVIGLATLYALSFQNLQHQISICEE